jgi:hypothetical protein
MSKPYDSIVVGAVGVQITAEEAPTAIFSAHQENRS